MENSDKSDPVVPIPGAARRKSMVLSDEKLVVTGTLEGGGSLPIVITPCMENLNLISWATGHRSAIDKHLESCGGILFRGWKLSSPNDFEELMQSAFGSLLEYKNRSTPRTRIVGRVYSSTEYPAGQSIPFHNENSYAAQCPLRIGFFCLQPSESGGETPIADSRAVYSRIAPEIRDRFSQVGVLYVRNYGYGMDLSWQDVFQTQSRTEVEDYCNQWGIQFEWREDDALTTRQRLPAVSKHPKTGEPVWFNQAHLFHISSLPAEICATLRDLPREQLPRNAYYGDGTEMEAPVLAAIREAYQAESVSFPWQQGDVLLLDNVLVAHSRSPYVGSRKILTGMGVAWSWAEGMCRW